MRITFTIAAGVLAALLGGCSMLGGGTSRSDQPGSTAPATATIRGTVQAIDTNAQTLTVSADASEELSPGSGGSSQIISYGPSTTVHYEGRSYRPEDLEVGDRIEASVERNGDRLIARRIDVLSDVSGSTSLQLQRNG